MFQALLGSIDEACRGLLLKRLLPMMPDMREEQRVWFDPYVDSLGRALMDLDTAIEEMKKEQGITESVKSVRDGLDNMVDELLDKMINPERWEETNS